MKICLLLKLFYQFDFLAIEYCYTKEFLDYFNLKSLDQLPSLAEIKDFTDVDPALELLMPIDSLSSADQDSQIDVQSGSIEPEN